MPQEDPIEALRSAVKGYDDYNELCRLIDTARRVTETSKATLQRILRERMEIVELMRGLHIPYKDLDFEYKGNLVGDLRRFLESFGAKP